MMHASRLSLLGWLCAALALTFAASAEAQQATRARLLTQLDAAAFNESFPAVALATGASGRVTLSCNVAADGASACEAADETPIGLGFGAAAAAMSRSWTFAPREENGQAVASTLRLNIVFENEVPTRQALQGTQFVDATNETPSPIAQGHLQLTEERISALSCSWGGRHCWSQPSSSSQTRDDENPQYYPLAARQAGVGGRALVACAIRTDRRVDCGVESEAPSGHEFGVHAQRLVSDIAARLSLEPGAVFRVPVQFGVHARGTQPARLENLWERRPTAQDFTMYYPPEALRSEHEGRTMLLCEILADRRINCTSGFEDPQNEGFGQAAAAISRSFLLSEEMFGTPGYTVGERIRIPISFRIG
jgi:hypothetical protein